MLIGVKMYGETESFTNDEAADCLYRLVDLHESVLDAAGHVPDPDVDSRDTFLAALRHIAVYVAGADGYIAEEERNALSAVFWQDYDDTDPEAMRAYQKDNPKIVHTMIKYLEEMIRLHAQVSAQADQVPYNADNDLIIQGVSTLCQTVLAADRPAESEVKRLSYVTSRLREYAVEVEREIAAELGVEPAQVHKAVAAGTADAAKAPSSLEDILGELHRLVGLASVKEEVETLANLAKVFAIRKERGMAVPDMSFHLVFLGNPGTGKTTVARIISQLYGQLGLLSSGHLVEVDRSGLVGNYVGQTATKVQEVVAKAMGGVLFIDEAYALAAKGENDFGREAIETLLKAMEDHRKNLIVIVAGYSHQMQDFLASNPGLRSRFSRDLPFVDYTAEEMVEIFRRMAEEAHYTVDPAAEPILKTALRQRWENRGPNFANARDVRNFFERSVSEQANRLGRSGSFSESDLCALTADDLQRAA
jgi:SpoVK/Ycf46/Vps4 family AAA+-type ATPase